MFINRVLDLHYKYTIELLFFSIRDNIIFLLFQAFSLFQFYIKFFLKKKIFFNKN